MELLLVALQNDAAASDETMGASPVAYVSHRLCHNINRRVRRTLRTHRGARSWSGFRPSDVPQDFFFWWPVLAVLGSADLARLRQSCTGEAHLSSRIHLWFAKICRGQAAGTQEEAATTVALASDVLCSSRAYSSVSWTLVGGGTRCVGGRTQIPQRHRPHYNLLSRVQNVHFIYFARCEASTGLCESGSADAGLDVY